MKVVENVSLQTHSSFAAGGTVRFLVVLETPQDVFDAYAFAKEHDLPLMVSGEGTNTLYTDGLHNIVLAKMQIRGIEVISDTPTHTDIRVAGGEQWDTLVAWSVTQNLSGLEALSLIPGTVGAAPIQNIGAYGAEFKDVCISVEVFETAAGQIRKLPREACRFAYRDSIFKQNPGTYIVTHVVLRLHKSQPAVPTYKDLVGVFANDSHPTVQEIRDAVIQIRTRKLPDYKQIPNVGSYFKNPLLSPEAFVRVRDEHPEIPHSQTDSGEIKLFAGWLIEQTGYKGKTLHNITVHHANALILTNPLRVSYGDLEKAEAEIVGAVQQQFGVTLEREPVLICATD